MVRRTISLTENVDALVRETARPGESYSAAIARLIEAGVAAQGKRPPRYVRTGKGPRDLGRRAEQYLRDAGISR